MSNKQTIPKCKKQNNTENRVEEVKAEQDRPVTKQDSISLHKGSLTQFHVPYKLGPEGKKAFETFLPHLIGQKNKDGKEKLCYDSIIEHCHPVGASVRALFNDLIWYDNAREVKTLDIGTATTRLNSRFYKSGAKLTESIDSLQPILSGRDLLRKKLYPQPMDGMCECKGGEGLNNLNDSKSDRCDKCLKTIYDVVMAVDGLYYPGVLEELVEQDVKRVAKIGGRGLVGYFTFNDYHAAILKTKSNQGKCCDGESKFEIGEDGLVRSFVNGNPAPYKHQVLSTYGNESWQYKVKSEFGTVYYVVFEVLKTFYNGDVPYRLCRATPMKMMDLQKFGESAGVEDIPLMDGQFLTKEYFNKTFDAWNKIAALKEVDLSTSTAPESIPEIVVHTPILSNPLMPDLAVAFKQCQTGLNKIKVHDPLYPVPEDTTRYIFKANNNSENPAETRHRAREFAELRLKEYIKRRPVKVGELEVDFKKRVDSLKEELNWFTGALSVFKSTMNEKFYYSHESDGSRITLQLTEDHSWYNCCPTRRQYSARVKHVMEAYVDLGPKMLQQTIEYSISQFQKIVQEKREDIHVLDVHEIVTIAHIIRTQQMVRFSEAKNLSSSAQSAAGIGKKMQ